MTKEKINKKYTISKLYVFRGYLDQCFFGGWVTQFFECKKFKIEILEGDGGLENGSGQSGLGSTHAGSDQMGSGKKRVV